MRKKELSNKITDWLKVGTTSYWFLTVFLYFSNSDKEAYFNMFLITLLSCIVGYTVFGIINFIIDIGESLY